MSHSSKTCNRSESLAPNQESSKSHPNPSQTFILSFSYRFPASHCKQTRRHYFSLSNQL